MALKSNRTYRIWLNMKSRCQNKNNPAYPRYGRKGIRVCEDWQVFSSFLRDMGEVPEGKSLDRIDNSLGYCRDNCRWADIYQQNQNRSGWAKGEDEVGVGFDSSKGKWRARCRRFGECYFLGHFDNKEEAVAARVAFVRGLRVVI